MEGNAARSGGGCFITCPRIKLLTAVQVKCADFVNSPSYTGCVSTSHATQSNVLQYLQYSSRQKVNIVGLHRPPLACSQFRHSSSRVLAIKDFGGCLWVHTASLTVKRLWTYMYTFRQTEKLRPWKCIFRLTEKGCGHVQFDRKGCEHIPLA